MTDCEGVDTARYLRQRMAWPGVLQNPYSHAWLRLTPSSISSCVDSGEDLAQVHAGTFGIHLREQVVLVEAIGDAVSEVVLLVQEKMAEHAEFRDNW